MYFVGLSLDIYIAGHGFMHLLLPLFVCLMKTKNPDFVSKSGFCLLRVVPPGIEHIICPVRKRLVHSVLIYLKIIETTESDYMKPSSYFNNLLSSSH